MELILASSSPRRQELLRSAGFAFVVRPSNVPEELQPGEAPMAFSERLARDKAAAVWGRLPQSNETLVLGADTIVVVDEHILGKPADGEDAARMLRLLSGRVHQVITSVCLLGQNVDVMHSEKTIVHVDALSDQEIAGYVATGEPMDKAGAYGIQGVASRWIPRIEGDYSTIVGLPVAAVYRLLRAHGAI